MAKKLATFDRWFNYAWLTDGTDDAPIGGCAADKIKYTIPKVGQFVSRFTDGDGDPKYWGIQPDCPCSPNGAGFGIELDLGGVSVTDVHGNSSTMTRKPYSELICDGDDWGSLTWTDKYIAFITYPPARNISSNEPQFSMVFGDPGHSFLGNAVGPTVITNNEIEDVIYDAGAPGSRSWGGGLYQDGDFNPFVPVGEWLGTDSTVVISSFETVQIWPGFKQTPTGAQAWGMTTNDELGTLDSGVLQPV